MYTVRITVCRTGSNDATERRKLHLTSLEANVFAPNH